MQYTQKPFIHNEKVFLKPIYQRILRICTMALLYYYDQNPFRISTATFATRALETRATSLLKCSRLQIFEQKRDCQQSISYFPFMFLFKRVVIPARSKAPICTRKRNPEDSGRSSEMASSCPWPFLSFPLASSLLNSSFYFNPSGTLQSSTVVSYDIINMDKKLNLFALRQKSRVWPLQKIGNFCNYQNFKDAYSFLSGDKILCSLY